MPSWWAESFVDMQGIPSEESFGVMTLDPGPVTALLGGIPSAEAFGSMTVQGPTQTVSLTGIPSAEAFGGSVVSPGAVNVGMFGIPGGEAFGSMSVGRGPVTVGLSGIPSAEAFGTMTAHTGIQLVGVNVSNTDTVAIPSHLSGDCIIIAAGRGNNTALPTKPTASGTVPGWQDIDNNTGANSCCLRTAGFVTSTNTTTSGTWTNATAMAAIVIRGQAGTPLGASAEAGGVDSTLAVAPSVSLINSSGSSFLVHIVMGSVGGSTWGTTPAGYTLRNSNSDICVFTKNVTTSDGAVSYPRTASLTRYRGATIEMLAT